MGRGERNAAVSMTLGLILTYLLCAITVTHGFNLDTRLPVIKRGEAGSYFGYSVAEHQQIDEKTIGETISWFVSNLFKNYQTKGRRSKFGTTKCRTTGISKFRNFEY